MTVVLTDPELQRLLADDVPYGDVTTTALGITDQPARIDFFARSAMTLSASEEAARLLELAGARVDFVLPSGSRVAAQTHLLSAHGRAGELHRASKLAQTLMEFASGVASAAHSINDALRDAGLSTPVACTRKNIPGTKAIAVKSILAGGALMHRLGLSETLLVFAEHRAFIPEGQLPARLAQLKSANPEKKLVAAVRDVEEAVRLAEAGVDVRATSAPFFAPPADVKVMLGPKAAGVGSA